MSKTLIKKKKLKKETWDMSFFFMRHIKRMLQDKVNGDMLRNLDEAVTLKEKTAKA